VCRYRRDEHWMKMRRSRDGRYLVGEGETSTFTLGSVVEAIGYQAPAIGYLLHLNATSL
jgi:hypothetical protein